MQEETRLPCARVWRESSERMERRLLHNPNVLGAARKKGGRWWPAPRHPVSSPIRHIGRVAQTEVCPTALKQFSRYIKRLSTPILTLAQISNNGSLLQGSARNPYGRLSYNACRIHPCGSEGREGLPAFPAPLIPGCTMPVSLKTALTMFA